jgi:hypothetical protein
MALRVGAKMSIKRTLYELMMGSKAYLKKKSMASDVSEAKGGGEPVYFKNIKRKQSYEDQLKAAGVNWETDRPSKRLIRKK